MKYLPLFLFLGYLFVLPGCSSKKDDPCKNLICDPVPFSPAFHLTIRDKTSGQDYFFSSPALYPYSALKITQLNDTSTINFRVLVDTLSATHSFLVGPIGKPLLLSLNGAKPDTLRFTYEFYAIGCCGTGALLSNVKLNSQPVIAKFDAYKDNAVLIITK